MGVGGSLAWLSPAVASLGYSRFTAGLGLDDEINNVNVKVVFQVFGDGVNLFESGEIFVNTPIVLIDLNITGVQELKLIVLPSGSVAEDHADWVDAKLHTSGSFVYLSDLNWVSSINEWGPVEKDRSNGENSPTDGNPLTINGVVYAKGLGVHAYSEIVYALP